ncbi:hypothetical protein MNBD_ALPHA09-703 [hydrothermal vent metagenome]|uniref:Flagellar trans-acting factor FliX n=1 Tax=hydrothermal vent metagenome TaxID=652676 RepID=A0A3B0TWB4_9ZZZZ
MIAPIRPSTTPKPASALRRKAGTAKAGSFAPASGASSKAASGGGAGVGPATGVVASLSIASVDAVMALQSVDDPAGRKARAVERGTRILDDLDELKIALLEGRISTGQLNRIIGLIAARREHSGDDRLDDVLDGIDLRAQVELAKLGR